MARYVNPDNDRQDNVVTGWLNARMRELIEDVLSKQTCFQSLNITVTGWLSTRVPELVGEVVNRHI
jgi:hypothetical protein